MTESIEDFARKHDLVLGQNAILGKVSRHIQGQNGFVMETDRPDRLLVGIIFLTGWERIKMEFRLAYWHIRVIPNRSSDNSLCAEFSPENERQARLVIELAQLKEMDTIASNMTAPYKTSIPPANRIVASVLRIFARALRQLAR